MPRTTTIVTIFLSSPGDVARERELLESLVAEHNSTWSERLGVTFEVLNWESDVRPAVSSDPQQAVNEQIADDYDVFIGILWGRFGTPTPRAASGTYEEFSRAYRRYQETGMPEIMFYFKDSALPPSKIDPEELARVQAFQDELPSKGGLYATFENESAFQTSLRAHLAALAQQFAQHERPTEEPPSAEAPPPEAEGREDDEDLGFLDYVELYQTRMADLSLSLEAINHATSRIGEQMNRRSGEVKSLSTADLDPKDARRVVKKAADDMDGYAGILEKHVPLMTSAREAALQALTRALTLYEEFGEATDNDLGELRSGLESLHSQAAGSYRGLKEYRETVRDLPRLTSDLNRAKRNVTRQLDTMLEEISATSDNVGNILESIQRIENREE